MSRTLATLLVALTLLLAGCTDDEPATTDEGQDPPPAASGADEAATSGPADEEAPADDSTGDESGNATEPAVNTPPTASLSAGDVTGAVPFNVTFMLDGADADGDVLSWTLDVDGDGVADTEGQNLPFNFTYSYVDVGNYTVTFNVTDGKDAAAETLVVAATEPVSTGPIQEVEGSWAIGGVPECYAGIYTPEADGVFYALFEVDAASIGAPFTVQLAATVPSLPDDAPVSGWGIDFLDEAQEYMSTFGADADGLASGEVPAGAVYGAFWSCLGGDLSATYVAG